MFPRDDAVSPLSVRLYPENHPHARDLMPYRLLFVLPQSTVPILLLLLPSVLLLLGSYYALANFWPALRPISCNSIIFTFINRFYYKDKLYKMEELNR